MQVVTIHPVPVRWRPPRAREDRHSLMLTRTPVEIPEVPASAFEPAIVSCFGTEIPCLSHEGALWQRLSRDVLTDGLATPVSPDHFSALLSGSATQGGHVFRAGTPLVASIGERAAVSRTGEVLPASITNRAGTDHTAAVRAALRDHVARTFRTDGTSVYARRGAPVMIPHESAKLWRYEAPDVLGRRGYGICFEAARAGACVEYLGRIGYRGYHVKAPALAEMFLAGLSDQGSPGDDLRLWVNNGPVLFGAMHADALDLGRKCDYDLSSIEAHAAPLRHYADLGLVGAIPEADHAHVADLLGRAIDAMRAAIPASHPQPPLNWLKAYSDIVARPALCQAPIPDEDTLSLGSLSP
jgi:hypothetical protein